MPTLRREPTPADALSRYRNALVRGASPEELVRLALPLDPDLVETLHWTSEAGHHARRAPDPLFAKRLERDLLHAFAPSATAPQPFRAAPAPLLGERRQAPPARSPELETTLLRPKWAWGQLAAAALLVFVLAGSVLALRFVSVDRPQTQLGATGEPATETLVDAVVDGAPEVWTPMTVERWQFMPGSTTLTIPPLDGPQWIAADTGPVVVTVDGEGQSLAPGQGLVVPTGQALELRNPGLDETSAYRGVAAAGFSLEEYDRDLITSQIALDTEAHESLPPGPSRIVFDRLTIPRGTSMMAQAATGQDWFDIVTGELGLTLIGDAPPLGWQSGREQELTADNQMPVLVPGTSVTMRNIGDDPLVLLRLRVSPLDGEASESALAG